MTIALTFFSTFSLCLIINIIFLIVKKNKALQTQGQLIQISKELENVRQEKEQQKNELFFQIKTLQNKVSQFEIQNQLLTQEKNIIENEKKSWSKEKEIMLHKLSEELIKKSHAQQEIISKNQEENIKKITLELFQNFENVTNKVSSLNDQVQKSNIAVELTNQALLNPGGSGKSSEITLENILKNSGLKEKQSLNDNGDYLLQSHFSNYNYSSIEGKRPDAILFFSNNQVAVIDSKSSSHFIDLQKARAEKDKKLEKEILIKIKESFKKHLESLKKKDYGKIVFESLFNKKISDYKVMTIMFLQTEKMLEIIHEIEPDFEKNALENNIIIATPIGLINLLSQARIVIDRIKQEKNIEILKVEIKKLLDKVALIFKDSSELGKSLNKAINHHDKITKNLNRGIYNSIEKISELGIESKKSQDINKIEEQ